MPRPASGASGWLLHLSSRNVIATSVTPLDDSGRVVGFRVRLLESEGRPANLARDRFRPVKSASTVDFLGMTLAELKLTMAKSSSIFPPTNGSNLSLGGKARRCSVVRLAQCGLPLPVCPSAGK